MRIGHRVTLLAALVAGAAPLAAQTKVLVGPTLGINSAKNTGDNQEDASRRTGLHLGGFASFSLGRLAIQPEVTYTSKGSKWVDDDAEIKIGYIQVPLLARYRFASEDARFRPYVMFGPAVAFKAGCTLIVSGGEYECSDETTAVAGTDFGLMFGAGAELGPAQFSIRYDRGLKNINGDGPANVKNQVIRFAVGYGFRLGR